MFEVESRIERLEQTVIALTSLVEQPAALDPAKGVTEGVKAALRLVAPRGLYPPTLRMQLENAGFHFANQKNPIASIHAVLKRLVNQGSVRSGQTAGQIAYYWHSNDAGTRRSRKADKPAVLSEQ